MCAMNTALICASLMQTFGAYVGLFDLTYKAFVLKKARVLCSKARKSEAETVSDDSGTLLPHRPRVPKPPPRKRTVPSLFAQSRAANLLPSESFTPPNSPPPGLSHSNLSSARVSPLHSPLDDSIFDPPELNDEPGELR